MGYDLELEKAVEEINNQNAKKVCIQLPDGLKSGSEQIKKEIEKKTNSEVIIWLGSCFGACDVPSQIESLGVDLLIQFGHSPWKS